MNRYSFIILILLFIYAGCSDKTAIVGPPLYGEQYQKIFTVQNGNKKFEIYTIGNDTLMTGYNKIGFKVFENDVAKNTGYVKFYAKMFHFTSTEFHATPVEPQYNYDAALEMFSGYLIMLMPSDTTSRWYGYYNYNDEWSIDSVNFDVGWDTKTKFKIFTDIQAEKSYLITIKEPENPVKGINNLVLLLHESPNFIDFTQVNTASMYLRPHLDSLNHTSSDNENPVYIGGGLYSGEVNFDYSGGWKMYDSIYYNSRCITRDGTPYVYFQVP